MSKYLVKVNYTSEGNKGLQKEGGTARKTYVEKLVSELGGKVESFYFAFGEIDAFLVIDFPDTASAAAVSFCSKFIRCGTTFTYASANSGRS